MAFEKNSLTLLLSEKCRNIVKVVHKGACATQVGFGETATLETIHKKLLQ